MNVGYDDAGILKKYALRVWWQDYGLSGWAGATWDSCLALAAHVTVVALVVNLGAAMSAVLCHKPR